MRVNADSVRFRTGRLWMQTALLEGVYPSLDRVVSQPVTGFVELFASCFLHALDRVILLADKQRLVNLTVNGPADLRLSAQSESVGHVEENVPVLAHDGEQLAIAFNGGYMKDIMRAAGDCRLRIAFAGPRKPIRITPVDDNEALFAITPIQTAQAVRTQL